MKKIFPRIICDNLNPRQLLRDTFFHVNSVFCIIPHIFQSNLFDVHIILKAVLFFTRAKIHFQISIISKNLARRAYRCANVFFLFFDVTRKLESALNDAGKNHSQCF